MTKSIMKPIAVGVLLAAGVWGGSSYGQTASDPTLSQLQQTVVSLQEKMAEADPTDVNYIALVQQELTVAQAELDAHVAATTKPVQQLEPVSNTPNATAVHPDPNWVPSFISTGDPVKDAEIVHQYKVSKGLEKDEE